MYMNSGCLIFLLISLYFRSNTAQEASNTRNALANGLYSRLFDYIINSINKLLSYSLQVYGGVSTIGILDIFGFENMLNNSFEQLCINTASEQMEFYFNQFVFCWEKEEYILEGITVNFTEKDISRFCAF